MPECVDSGGVAARRHLRCWGGGGLRHFLPRGQLDPWTGRHVTGQLGGQPGEKYWVPGTRIWQYGGGGTMVWGLRVRRWCVMSENLGFDGGVGTTARR
jgi:hypothetical protein